MRTLAPVLVALVLLGACGGGEEVHVGAGPGGVELAEEYVSVRVTAGGERRPLVEGTEIRLRVDGEQLGASLGCNQLGGPFRVEGTTLVLEELTSTQMGCDPERHDQDRWFADLLTSRPQLLTSGDEIQINDGFTLVVLRDADVAEPDRPLLGTTWQVDGFVDDGSGPDVTSSWVAVDRPGTLELRDDLVAVGFDGCASFGDAIEHGEVVDALRFELDGGRLTFAGTPPTEGPACEGPAAEHAERYRSVVSGTVTWSVDADRLTLTAEDGRGVTFRAVEG